MAVALLCDDDKYYLPMLTANMFVPIDSLSTVEIANATYEELEVYRKPTYDYVDSDTGEAVRGSILPNPDYNFAQPWKWETTIIDANFDLTLEVGQLQGIGGLEITSIALLRSSIRDNFANWEEIAVFKTDDLLRKTFKDYIVESGVLYRYAIQPISLKIDPATGLRSEIRAPLGSKKYGIVSYESVWMIGSNGVQVKLHYNPNISEFKNVVKDSIVETIGSKYPFIIRNSNVGYKQFSFSGTMTVDVDLEKRFLGDSYYQTMSDTTTGSDEDIELIYKGFVSNMPSPMGDYNTNYIKERELRNKLIEWFNNGEPKLYKSDTEGLILCKLTDVRLTPKNELGRTIYDFNCLITEIGDTDRDTLVKYGIIKSEYEFGEEWGY